MILAVGSLWLCASLPIFSQEAYYWTYSRHPDLSYFDHPPMVAWLIWLGTHVLGDGAMGVRLGTWAAGMLATMAGNDLLRRFGVHETARAAWILCGLLSPIVAMSHFLANPDAPLVAAWTVTMAALWRARDGAWHWWLLAGVAAGLALLSKYTAVFLAPAGLLVLLFDPAMRRQLRGPWPYLAVVTAGVVFAPVVLWNMRHDFASFHFQADHRYEQARFGLHWFLQLLGGQFGLLHPLLAVLLPTAVAFCWRRWRGGDLRGFWLLAFGLPLPAYLLASSLWIQVKMNWLAPAYVALLLGLVWWWHERRVHAPAPPSRWARLGTASLLLLPAVMPFAPAIRLLPPGRGSSWSGWDEIAACAAKWADRVDGEDGRRGNTFLFAADYRDAAQLGRNLCLLEAATPAAPHRETLAHNVLGMPALQYDFWERPTVHLGQDAVFVLPRPARRGEVLALAQQRFARIELAEHLSVDCHGLHITEADIFLCHHYLGPQPPRR